MESELAGSQGEFLARVQRFTDMMLDRLVKSSDEKDADDRETRMLGNVVLKALATWEKALQGKQPITRLKEVPDGKARRAGEKGDN